MRSKKTKHAEKSLSREVPLTVLLSMAAGLLSFAAVIFSVGYILYVKEADYSLLWMVYLGAAVFSAAVASFIGGVRLPFKGIIVGLIYAFGGVLIHSVVLSLISQAHSGNRTMFILCSVIAVAVLSGILGANVKKRKR